MHAISISADVYTNNNSTLNFSAKVGIIVL